MTTEIEDVSLLSEEFLKLGMDSRVRAAVAERLSANTEQLLVEAEELVRRSMEKVLDHYEIPLEIRANALRERLTILHSFEVDINEARDMLAGSMSSLKTYQKEEHDLRVCYEVEGLLQELSISEDVLRNDSSRFIIELPRMVTSLCSLEGIDEEICGPESMELLTQLQTFVTNLCSHWLNSFDDALSIFEHEEVLVVIQECYPQRVCEYLSEAFLIPFKSLIPEEDPIDILLRLVRAFETLSTRSGTWFFVLKETQHFDTLLAFLLKHGTEMALKERLERELSHEGCAAFLYLLKFVNALYKAYNNLGICPPSTLSEDLDLERYGCIALKSILNSLLSMNVHTSEQWLSILGLLTRPPEEVYSSGNVKFPGLFIPAMASRLLEGLREWLEMNAERLTVCRIELQKALDLLILTFPETISTLPFTEIFKTAGTTDDIVKVYLIELRKTWISFSTWLTTAVDPGTGTSQVSKH
ncbi:hypothetical protein GMRT_12307 [Giardia muris]|uniref:Uncharacterized protein n=1 Tax=Giardia muris TaxID=5742 RepID=A0A4Z1SXW5_GIAMU|nr:hypothetical protein GMRT_12307 [Giardia muris]|eukprot:TNJ30536.1 hypothetical protein GMRT_12307 [Giardia muris]